MIKLLYLITIFSGLFGAYIMYSVIASGGNAAQETAAGIGALTFTLVPYFITRAIQEIAKD